MNEEKGKLNFFHVDLKDMMVITAALQAAYRIYICCPGVLLRGLLNIPENIDDAEMERIRKEMYEVTFNTFKKFAEHLEKNGGKDVVRRCTEHAECRDGKTNLH